MKSTRADIEKHLQEGFCLIQQKVDVADKSQVLSYKNYYKQIEYAHLQLNMKLTELNHPTVSIIVNNAGIIRNCF